MESFKVIGFTPVLTDNLRQGDCYYSAIYRALQPRGLLPLVNACKDIPIDTEEKFIQSARNIVAQKVIDGGAMSLYESYMVNFAADIETLKLQVDSAPQYLIDFLQPKIDEKELNQNLDFVSYDEFAEEMAKNIRIMGTWSGETEVRIFKQMLSNCEIILDIYVDKQPKGKLPKRVGTKYYIYLYNVGEIHWKHFQLTGDGVQVNLKRDMTPGIINSRWQEGGKRKTRYMKKQRIHKKNKTRKN